MAEAPTAEPSMEEILASIRKIIADEKDPAAEAAPAAPEEDVLELTQMVQDDGSVVDLAPKAAEPMPEEPVAAADAFEAVPAAMPEVPKMEPVMPLPPEPAEDSLVSEKVATVATSSLASLANTLNMERMAASAPMTPFGNGARTLEDMVMALMKPMLKEWLDQNLPPIVERVVQKEVERIARRVPE